MCNELKDLEQKCKNGAKEVKLSCEESIQAVKLEIGNEVQKLAKQITWFATSSYERIFCLFSRNQASRHSL